MTNEEIKLKHLQNKMGTIKEVLEANGEDSIAIMEETVRFINYILSGGDAETQARYSDNTCEYVAKVKEELKSRGDQPNGLPLWWIEKDGMISEIQDLKTTVNQKSHQIKQLKMIVTSAHDRIAGVIDIATTARVIFKDDEIASDVVSKIIAATRGEFYEIWEIK